jgi:putative intracellular protease/amidase
MSRVMIGCALCLALAGCVADAPSAVTVTVTPGAAAARTETLTLAPARRRNVAIVIYQGVELLDFAGPGEVFAANRAFRTFTVAATSAPVVSQHFVSVIPDYTIDHAPAPDVVLIPGGSVHRLLDDVAMKAWLERSSKERELTISVCNGAFALAATGALDGQRATSHWLAVDALRKEFPRIVFVPDERYVDNGRAMTTAGISAGIDGALHVVQRFAGEESAWSTARYMQYAWVPEDGTIPGRAPLSPERRLAMRAWILHDWEAAARGYGALARRSPDDGHAHARLGDSLVHLGRREEGLAELDRARALGQRDPETLKERANALHGMKREDEAVLAFEDLARASEGERPAALYNEGCALAVIGKREEALSALERAVEAGFDDGDSLERDPDLSSLRSDPKLAKLAASARRSEAAPRNAE